jgi:hypothetical protein
MMKQAAPSSDAVEAIERELVAVHRCIDVLGLERLLWLRDAFADRACRLASSLDSARRGWPPG